MKSAQEISDFVRESLAKIVSKVPTLEDDARAIRGVMAAVIRSHGAVLKDDNTIVDENDEVIAWFDGGKFTETGIQFDIKMKSALDHLPIDLKIKE